jgi:hypothetical protein
MHDTFVTGRDWSALVSLGDAYLEAADSTSARLCYRAAASGPDAGSSRRGMERLMVLRWADAGPAAVADTFALSATAVARRRTLEAPVIPERFRGIAIAPRIRERPRRQGMMALIEAHRNGPPAHRNGPPADGDGPQEEGEGHQANAGAQNVHDHGVSTAVFKNCRAVMAEAGGATPGAVTSASEAVRAAIIDSKRSADEKTAALAVLEDVTTPPVSLDVHSAIGATAAQVLAAVWRLIVRGSEDGSERRSDLVDGLVSQMATGIERGGPVCLSGKIARFVSALDHQGLVPALTDATPMWLVRRELNDMAAKVRESGGGAPEFEELAMRTYCDEIGMARGVILPMVAIVCQGFD